MPHGRHPSLRPILPLMLAVLALLTPATASAGRHATRRHAAAMSPAGIRAQTSSTSLSILNGYLAAMQDPSNGFGAYFAGFWAPPNPICWSCDEGGPATAAATLYMLDGRTQPSLLSEAETTIDLAIATRQQPDGSFMGPPGDTQPGAIATMFFADELGNTYLELLPVLDPTRRARWKQSLVAAANYFLTTNDDLWYTNGNIALGQVELFYLAYAATGDTTFQAAYNNEWNFALMPSATDPMWAHHGLRLTKWPTRSDWSDGAGYLTETGGGGTGFDPEYTTLQLDVADRIYLLSGDVRALRLANVLVNTESPRIDSGYWLNTSRGTRHTDANRYVPLLTSSFAVLGLDGGRTDLVPDILGQLSNVETTQLDPSSGGGAVWMRALGTDVSVIALASSLQHPVGWAQPGLGVATIASTQPLSKPRKPKPKPCSHAVKRAAAGRKLATCKHR